MAQFSRPKPKRDKRKSGQSTDQTKHSLVASRLIVLYGLPLSGVTSAIRCLVDATETPTALVLGIDSSSEGEIRSHMRDGKQVIFVDDFDPTIDALQFLHDSRLVSSDNPDSRLVQIWSADEDILARAEAYGRPEVTKEYLDEYRRYLEPFEERMRELSTPRRSIPNGLDFAGVVMSLAELAGITE